MEDAMGRILILVAALMFVAQVLRAQTVEVAPEPGIEAAISDQMEAFRADDFETAFTFASPNIQSMFGTPQRFGAMVSSGYPMVHRPADVQFLELRQINGLLWQKILVRDASGAFHALDYQMVQGAGGAWRINGVQILQAPQVGA
jgi:hypothetical protein